MSHLPTLFAIGGVYFLAVASPGPNFLVVSQLALTGRARLGLTVAAGVATGSAIWAVLAMLGVAALLAHIGPAYALLRLGGAAYLVWFGAKLLWNARTAQAQVAADVRVPASSAKAFRAGLLTNLTNPKAGAFWTSIFSSMFPAHAPLWLFGATLAMVIAISGGWYSLMAIGLATDRVQRRYLGMKRGIEAACGGLLVVLGVHLAASR